MELTKDVHFNLEKFIKGKSFTINYSGQLFQANSDEVFINFGYGQNWNNKNELKMTKTNSGFSAQITPVEANEFNFCFRNNNNIWDNNSYKNYSIDIEQDYVTPIEQNSSELYEGNLEFQEELETLSNNKMEEFESNEESTLEYIEPIVEQAERKTFNIDAIIDEILNTEITPSAPVEFKQEVKEEKVVIPSENPTHVNKTSLLVEDVLVPFYTNEDNGQFLPVDTTTYSKFFTIKRKIKLAIYRILHTIPKILTGNYKKKSSRA